MYMLLRERDLHNDNYYKCLCGTHVRTGAFIVAIIGVVFGLIQLLSASTPCLNSGIVKYNILCGLLTIFVNSLVICADQKEKPWAYLPYIIFKGLVILFYAFVVIVLLIIGIFAPSDAPTIFSGKTPEEQIMAVRIVFISGAIVLLIFNAFLLWFASIVFRAYQYMREAVNQGILGNQQEIDDRIFS
uniref:Lysosomal-associated transmembrane protein 4B n=1 Tax=Acrobeloides nanus TaxID=290746 RepID=A0A914D8M2_9BILA